MKIVVLSDLTNITLLGFLMTYTRIHEGQIRSQNTISLHWLHLAVGINSTRLIKISGCKYIKIKVCYNRNIPSYSLAAYTRLLQQSSKFTSRQHPVFSKMYGVQPLLVVSSQCKNNLNNTLPQNASLIQIEYCLKISAQLI